MGSRNPTTCRCSPAPFSSLLLPSSPMAFSPSSKDSSFRAECPALRRNTETQPADRYEPQPQGHPSRKVTSQMFRSTKGLIAAGVVVASASLLLAGCSSASTLGGSTKTSKESIVVGSANFSENVILADIYGQALADNGFKVTYHLNIGARAAYIPAVKKGEVNLIPEYSGSILDFLDNKATANSPADVDAALAKALPKGLTALKASTA